MAESDVPGLGALTGAGSATGDLVHVVDVSDTTSAADGTDKKMTLAELATAVTTHGALATDAEVTTAVSNHAAAADPHTGYVLESLVGAVIIDADFARKVDASVTINDTAYMNVDTATDLTLGSASKPIVAGDLLKLDVSCLTQATGQLLRLDAATIVSAAVVNYVSGVGAAGSGVQAWHSPNANQYGTPGGTVPYTIQAGDIVAGVVVVRLRGKIDAAGARDIICGSTTPLTFYGEVLRLTP